MISVTEELNLIQAIEGQLLKIQSFIQEERHRVFESVPMDDLMELLAELDLSLKTLREKLPIKEEKVDPATWELLQSKRFEVKELFSQTIKEFESWREVALAEGQTVNLKVKAGRSYNQMKPL